jgi:hypothetical protein
MHLSPTSYGPVGTSDLGGRDDKRRPPQRDVVGDAGDKVGARQTARREERDIEANGGNRIGDLTRLELSLFDTEIRGEQPTIFGPHVREPAVGVVHDHELGDHTRSSETDVSQHFEGLQQGRHHPAPRVADHGQLVDRNSEHMCGIDSWVDTGEKQASADPLPGWIQRFPGREPGVALEENVDVRHGRYLQNKPVTMGLEGTGDDLRRPTTRGPLPAQT